MQFSAFGHLTLGIPFAQPLCCSLHKKNLTFGHFADKVSSMGNLGTSFYFSLVLSLGVINNVRFDSSQKQCWLLAHQTYLSSIVMQIIAEVVMPIDCDRP